MIKKLLLLPFFAFISISNVMSQTSLKSGYVITLENDTIYGEIEIKTKLRNNKSCTFFKGDNKIDYYPNDIIGYGVIDDFYYISSVEESVFVEALILGDISLYKSEANFIISKGEKKYILTTKFTEVEVDGVIKMKEDNTWRGIISYLLSDCLKVPMDEVKDLTLTEEVLSKLVVDYNKCSGNEFMEVKGKKPWFKLGYGIIPAVQFSKISISEELGYPALGNSSVSSVDPSIGVLFNVSSPRVSDRISVNAEINYYQSNYSSYFMVSGTNTEHYETHINLKTLFLPLSFNYSVPFNKLSIELQAGVNFDVHFEAESNVSREVVIGNTVNSYNGFSFLEIRESQLGIFGGFGFQYSFNNINCTGLYRYTKFRDFSIDNGFKSSLSRSSISLIFSK